MKALITGCSGFVGRNFTRYLKELGWDVFGLDIADDPDEDAFKYFVNGYDDTFDLVVHCAYEVGGRSHIDGTNMALAHNVAMDAAMFEWALEHAVAVLYFSSSAAYPACLQSSYCALCDDARGRDKPVLLHEDDFDASHVSGPDANYGWAKVTGERVAKAAADNGLRVHVVRPFSGYGGDQSLQYPFPSIIKRARQGDLTVWGPKGQTRDWIHIDDVVRGAFAVYEADERRPVNLCTGIGTEMGQLMNLARWVDSGREPKYSTAGIKYLEDKPTGVFYRVGDPTRMNELYTATISIEEGVRMALGK